jgi:hypothetical protein
MLYMDETHIRAGSYGLRRQGQEARRAGDKEMIILKQQEMLRWRSA